MLSSLRNWQIRVLSTHSIYHLQWRVFLKGILHSFSRAIVPIIPTTLRLWSSSSEQQRVVKFTIHASFLKLLLDTFLDLFSPFDPPPFQIFIFPLKSLFILSKCAVHNSIKILFDLFDVLFCPHKSLHENVKFFVQSDNFYARVGWAVVIEHRGRGARLRLLTTSMWGGHSSERIV